MAAAAKAKMIHPIWILKVGLLRLVTSAIAIHAKKTTAPIWTHILARILTCYPTLPSREIPISRWVSAMNSIGSFCITSRTKPLTMSATASSSFMPRVLQ